MPERAAYWGDAHRYPSCVSIFRSISASLTHEATRLARDLPGAVGRARHEGERKVQERRYRHALQALGERAFALSRDGQLTAEALASEISEVEVRQAAVQRAEGPDADDISHDAAVAFPMLSDDAPT